MANAGAKAPLPDMTATLREHRVESASVAVIRNGRIVSTGAWGTAGPNRAATVATPYNLASLTKPLTAEVILRLVSAGKLSLDEPMDRYWSDPDLSRDPRRTKLTVRMTLSHRTGFPAGFVDDGQDAELAPVVGTLLNEVVCPYMTRIFRSQPDARTVVQPQPPAFRLLLRNPQSFASPNPLYPFMVHRPASGMQQRRHPAIAIATILPGQGNDILGQRLFVVCPTRHLALCRPVLPKHAAYPSLGDI